MVTRNKRLENLTTHTHYEQLRYIISRLKTMKFIMLAMSLVAISGIIGSRDLNLILGFTGLGVALVMSYYYMDKFDKLESSVAIDEPDTGIAGEVEETENPHKL